MHEYLLQICLSPPDGEFFYIEARFFKFVHLTKLDTIYQFHCKDASAAEFIIYFGDIHRIIIGEVAGKSLHVARFQSVVEFSDRKSVV